MEPDAQTNKAILYLANNLSELKIMLEKYEKIKMNSVKPNRNMHTNKIITKEAEKNKLQNFNLQNIKCYKCNEYGHYYTKCKKTKRESSSTCAVISVAKKITTITIANIRSSVVTLTK